MPTVRLDAGLSLGGIFAARKEKIASKSQVLLWSYTII